MQALLKSRLVLVWLVTVWLATSCAAQAGVTVVTSSTNQLSFGPVHIGSAATQSVTLTNVSVGPIVFSAQLGTSPLGGGDFSFQTDCPNGAAGSSTPLLPPGGTCSYQVTFRPSQAPGQSLTLFVTAGVMATNSQSVTINLSGSGSLFSVSLSPVSLDFGSVVYGQHSPAQSLTISNNDNVSFYVSSAFGGDFAAPAGDSGCGSGSLVLVAPKQSCSVSVILTPKVIGAETGLLNLSVYSVSPQELLGTLTANLTGAGLSPVTVSPSSLNFGSVSDGQTSAPQITNLTNIGGTDLNLSGGNFAGDFASPASAGGTVCGAGGATLLHPGQSCSISVTFTPQNIGTETGALSVNIFDTSSPVLLGRATANLSGSGHPLSVPAAVNFGFEQLGATATVPVAIVNGSASPVLISAVTVNGADFAQSNNCVGSLGAKSQCVIQVTYTPELHQTSTGVITISDDDATSPQTIQMQGTGVRNKLTVLPDNPRGLKGATVEFAAFKNGDLVKDDVGVSWSSSNPEVATIDGAGNVTLLSTGITAITATKEDKYDSTMLTVTLAAPPVFTTQPANTGVSHVINSGSGVKVQLLDLLGDPLPNQTVTIAIGTNGAESTYITPTVTLSGTLTQTTDATGTATFPDLKIDWLGEGYTLLATAAPTSGPVSATSAAFNEERVGDACLGPQPACASGCADRDGDGLNDVWETAGGIDLNGDGVVSDAKHDLLLPGADPNKPDIYVRYDWMDYGLNGQSCATDNECRQGAATLGESCGAAGTRYEGQCTYACSADSDCTSRWPIEAHAGERCVNNACQHTHDPLVFDPKPFDRVIARFAAHGINLHVTRGNAQPHSHLVSFRSDAEMELTCEGASLASENVGIGKYAVSLYALKPREASVLAYHYGLFSHYSGCDSTAHCPVTSPILSSCSDRKMAFEQVGRADIGGNDFAISLAKIINKGGVRPLFNLASTFMHELGHNLGLHHDGHIDSACQQDSDCRPGDKCVDIGDRQGQVCHETVGGVLGEEEPNFKPNYLSVMNYQYEGAGIEMAASMGSRLQMACTTDAECGDDGGVCLPPLLSQESHCAIGARVCTTNADCTTAGDSCLAAPQGYCSATIRGCNRDSDCGGIGIAGEVCILHAPYYCSQNGNVCESAADCNSGERCAPPSGSGRCARLDYSRQTLPVGGPTPGVLDEANLNDAIGLGSGTTDIFRYTDAACHIVAIPAPSTGPVNWAGTGFYTVPSGDLVRIGPESFTDTAVQADIDASGASCNPAQARDVLHGHTDWPDLSGIDFNYKFQCRGKSAK